MRKFKFLSIVLVALFSFYSANATLVTISGHVYNQDSVPVQGVNIYLFPDNTDDSLVTTTDENGYYRFQFDVTDFSISVTLEASYKDCQEPIQKVIQLQDSVLEYTVNFVICDGQEEGDSVQVCVPMVYYMYDWENPYKVKFASVLPQNLFNSNFAWAKIEYGDGTTEDFNGQTEHVYNNDGLYEVTVTAFSNSCNDTSQFTTMLFIFPLPDTLICFADFYYVLDSTGYTATFTAVTWPDSGAIYNWDFGDGQVASGMDKQMSHTYDTEGEYMVTLTVEMQDGCESTITQPVWIGEPDVTWFDEDTCQALFYTNYIDSNTVEFNDISCPGNGEIISYMWDLGDSSYSTLPNFTHTYADTGTYLVTLTIATDKGCSSSFSEYVYVGNYQDPDYCVLFYPNEGEDSLEVLFYNLSMCQGDWTWDFGDNKKDYAQGDVASHKYSHPGQYTVTLKDDNTELQYKMDIRVSSSKVEPITAYAVRKSMSKTNIDEYNDNIKIYPNPVSDYVVIDVLNNKGADISIVTMSGKVVFTHKYNSGNIYIKTDFLKPGIYLLKVNDKAYRIIKN